MTDLKYLYHATYLPLLESIKKTGLGGTTQTYWEDSKPGVVYLSTDKDVAISYAEANENIPEDWLDQIIVITVLFDSLDPEYLNIDENVQDNDGITLEYYKIIPSSLFYSVKQEESLHRIAEKNKEPVTRRFNHSNPGEVHRCLSCKKLFAIDRKPNIDFKLNNCPSCGTDIHNARLSFVDEAKVRSLKPKASILYYEA